MAVARGEIIEVVSRYALLLFNLPARPCDPWPEIEVRALCSPVDLVSR